ncbi:hypothetical protein ACHQM5_006924 [Ranunculus cassubicifolius]
MRIGKGVGTPIGVDKKTIGRDFGFFANVLIDVDFSKPIPEFINVKEEDGGQFAQEIFIPKMPQYCTHCNVVGHGIYNCRGLLRVMQPGESEQRMDRKANAENQPTRTQPRQANIGVRAPVAPRQEQIQRQQVYPSTPAVDRAIVQPQGAEVSVTAAHSRLINSLGGTNGTEGRNISLTNSQNEEREIQPIQTETSIQEKETSNTEEHVAPAIEESAETLESNHTQPLQDNAMANAPMEQNGEESLVENNTDPVQGNQEEAIQEEDRGGTMDGVPCSEPIAAPGQIRTDNALGMHNAFSLLTDSDPVPDSQAGIINEVNLVNKRMEDFLNGNKQVAVPVINRQPLRRGARGGSTSTTTQNRNSVEASCLGPRRSQRDITTPNRLDL